MSSVILPPYWIWAIMYRTVSQVGWFDFLVSMSIRWFCMGIKVCIRFCSADECAAIDHPKLLISNNKGKQKSCTVFGYTVPLWCTANLISFWSISTRTPMSLPPFLKQLLWEQVVIDFSAAVIKHICSNLQQGLPVAIGHKPPGLTDWIRTYSHQEPLIIIQTHCIGDRERKLATRQRTAFERYITLRSHWVLGWRNRSSFLWAPSERV